MGFIGFDRSVFRCMYCSSVRDRYRDVIRNEQQDRLEMSKLMLILITSDILNSSINLILFNRK
jgi:hypothetical protein